MESFIELLKLEIIATINGLVGTEPEVAQKDIIVIDESSSVDLPIAKINVAISGAFESSACVFVSPSLATALSDMMLGGEGEFKDTMEDDDVDAIKEVVSNILGSLSNSLNSQKVLPKLNFSAQDASFEQTDSLDLSGFSKMLSYAFKLNNIEDVIIFAFDETFIENIAKKEAPQQEVSQETPEFTMPVSKAAASSDASLSPEELKNISLLMDVKLTLRVRIGQKKMLLRDVIGMDIGSIVELEQLANEPLDILVDNKKIAEGEVVIVDGNFGIQITSIGSKKERLQQLRG